MNHRARSIRSYSRWRSAAISGALIGAVLAPASTMAAPRVDTPRPAAGVTVAATANSTAPRIEITRHKFSLPTVTVPVGATVTWVNNDEDIHTVVSTTDVFRSTALETDQAYSFTFKKPGVYQYFCTLHPLMTGSVIVK